MKAYFDSVEKEVPDKLREVFLTRQDTAVITIDMHDGHLSTDPDCPCPSPRGREIIEPLNHFMDEARALGLPVNTTCIMAMNFNRYIYFFLDCFN